MARKPTGNPTGRPPIKIDTTQFENLCGLQCQEEEFAWWFGCSVDTINNWCKKQYGETFSECYKKFSGKGKISLRRSQFRLAEKSATMAIFLGKQYLGQRDNLDCQTNVNNNGALEIIVQKKIIDLRGDSDQYADDQL